MTSDWPGESIRVGGAFNVGGARVGVGMHVFIADSGGGADSKGDAFVGVGMAGVIAAGGPDGVDSEAFGGGDASEGTEDGRADMGVAGGLSVGVQDGRGRDCTVCCGVVSCFCVYGLGGVAATDKACSPPDGGVG